MTTNFAVFAEKVIATYVQSLIGLYLLDMNDTLNTSTAHALAIAALPAAITVITASLPLVPDGLPYYLALFGNVARTFVQGFLGYLLALPIFQLDASVGRAALFAAIPACLAVLKGALASKVGNPTTPNLLPAAVDPAPRVVI
jgi:hypothetical protein